MFKKIASIIMALAVSISAPMQTEIALAANNGTVSENTAQIMEDSETQPDAADASSKRIVSVNLSFTSNEALAADGSLYMLGSMWGAHDDLGETPNGDHYTPVKILSNVESISTGLLQKGAITKNGDLYMWGDTGFGASDKLIPEKRLSDVAFISCNNNFTAAGAVKKDGSLYMWGANGNGALGIGTKAKGDKPVKVLSDVASFQLKGGRAGAVKKDGSLYMWGMNTFGQVGNGTTEDCFKPVKVLSDVLSVSMNDNCTGAITKDGSLYMWGHNWDGQLGDGTTEDRYRPIKVLSDVVFINMGGVYEGITGGTGNGTIGAITKDGSLYMWGSGYAESGDVTELHRPVKVLSDVVFINMGGDYTGAITEAITEDGSLYVWGDYDIVGDDITNYHTPVKVLSDVVSVKNMPGKNTVGAVTKDGSLYVWGKNDYGIVGDGTTEKRRTPVKVLSNVSYFDFGSDCCGAVTKDGSLYMWGRNENGQLGDGTKKDRHKPVKISFPNESPQRITYNITGINNRKVIYGSTFSLNAKSTGNTKLTYKSSNSKILSVNAKGKVKVKGCGPAYITIKAASGNGYKAAARKFKLIAVPKKGEITTAEWRNGGAYVRWKSDKKASGYEYAIAYNKKFTGQSRQKTNKTGILLTQYKKKGKQICVRVRTYKKVGKKLYYGSWSAVRSLQIKNAG